MSDNKYQFAIDAIKANYPKSGYTMLCEGLDTALETLQKVQEGRMVEVLLDDKTIKKVEYMITKECQRQSLTELCEEWDITVNDFYSYQYGERKEKV